ncbi:MAG: hypothetical protein WA547_04545 [Thermoplasmata archaeon]
MAAPPVSSDGPAICEPCPSGETGCIPNCTKGPPPCNPVPESVSITSIVVTPESTNVSFTWDESPAGYGGGILWGNTTSYGYSQSASGSASYTAFLDYIQPSTTYYFEIYTGIPASTCDITWSAGHYFSSFATPADPQLVVSGTVTDANGHAPAGVAVIIYCTDWVGWTNPGAAEFGETWESSPTIWWNYTLTNSNGAYSFNVNNYQLPGHGYDICNKNGGHHYVVDVLNQPKTCFDGVCPNGKLWAGYWNETIATWSPQVVNFVLPSNFLGPLTPMVLDFTNDSYVSFAYSSGVESTTTSAWQFDGAGESASVTTSDLTSLSTAPDEDLEYYAAYDQTGNIEFNAIDGRTTGITDWSYVGKALSVDQSSTTVADPLKAFYNVQDNEVCYAEGAGQSGTYITTYSQSFQLSSSFNLAISVDLDLFGVGSLTTSPLTYSNSISNGGGQSWSLSYTISVPSGGSTTNVWVYVQPGTTNQVGPIVHAWAGPTCPT